MHLVSAKNIEISKTQDLVEVIASEDEEIVLQSVTISQTGNTPMQTSPVLVYRKTINGPAAFMVFATSNEIQVDEGTVLRVGSFNIQGKFDWQLPQDEMVIIQPGQFVVTKLKMKRNNNLAVDVEVSFLIRDATTQKSILFQKRICTNSH